MRRTIITLLLAAATAAPFAAQAQTADRGAWRDRQQAQQQRPDLTDPRDRGDLRRSDAARDRQMLQDRTGERLTRRQQDWREDRRADSRDWRDDRGDRRDGWQDRRDGRFNDGRNDGRYDDRGRRDAYRGDRYGGNDRRWDNGWRQDRRYNWQGYRQSNRNVYRLPRYYPPRGGSYRRWSTGYRIDPYFYGSSYWINDPWQYRLPPVYGGYRWVRYYDDVILVDLRTGLIEDILYSFFWR